jgi:hypothetical protein
MGKQIIKKYDTSLLIMLYHNTRGSCIGASFIFYQRSMKIIIKTYKAIELAELEKKTKPTIYNNGRKYIPIQIPSKRSKKGYSIRYIKKSDLDIYFKENN